MLAKVDIKVSVIYSITIVANKLGNLYRFFL